MKIFIGLFIGFFLYFGLSAQKIKLQNNEVLVDKEKKFKLIIPSNSNGKPDKGNLTMLDLDGNIILEVRDTSFALDQLYYERTQRQLAQGFFIQAPQLGKSAIGMRYVEEKASGKIIGKLKEVKMFATCQLTPELFDLFMEKMDRLKAEAFAEEAADLNSRRKNNALLSKEKFGVIPLRSNWEHFKFLRLGKDMMTKELYVDDLHPLGKILKKSKSGSSRIYEFNNTLIKAVATLTVKQMEYKADLRTMIDNKPLSIPFYAGETDDILLTRALFYLVKEGYL